jgi:hypothetical protein
MQIKLFTIPIGDSGAALEEMNRFLRGNKILEVENHLISNENGAYWCFCVRYIEKTSPSAGYDKTKKVDYKYILDEVTFQKFSKLREIRKKVAADEGIPAFAVFSDEELAALERAKHFNKRYQWFLKLDFRKYFDSLDHSVVKKQLNRLFKDRRLLNIFESIADSYCVNQNQGVPIGNLTSQYFANHYLTPLDHYVKEVLKIEAYIRYMDDLVLWHDNKEILINAGFGLKQYSQRELSLTLKPFCLNRNSHGLPFLGYLVYPGKTRLAHRSRTRFIKKLRIYENNLISGKWTQEEYQNHVLPLIAFTEHANAGEFRKKVMANF